MRSRIASWAIRRLGNIRIKIEEQTKSYSEAAHLSNVRYQGGVTSFLEVQYNEQQYFNSQLSSHPGLVHGTRQLRDLVSGPWRRLAAVALSLRTDPDYGALMNSMRRFNLGRGCLTHRR